jgi:hypothetical protein
MRSFFSVASIILLSTLSACGHDHAAEPHLGTSATTDDGSFLVSYALDAPLAPLRYRFDVTVRETSGVAVEGAHVLLAFAAQGQADQAVEAAEVGDGLYVSPAVDLPAGGHWLMTVHVEQGGRHDHATFAVTLP